MEAYLRYFGLVSVLLLCMLKYMLLIYPQLLE